MVRALFDTNILIDHLNGVPEAAAEIGRYRDPAISVVTWMEVMAGAPAPAEQATRAFLAAFDTAPVDADVAETAVRIRRERRIRLPDAIIAATAEVLGALLVTRNTKDFDEGDPGVRVPYRR